MKKRRMVSIRKANWLVLLAILCLLCCGGCGKETETFLVEETVSEDSQVGAEQEGSGDKDPEKTEESAGQEQSKEIFVQVCGAVKQPGVYRLQTDSRVFEAVEMAGGLTDQADPNGINQAEGLTDGQMIYVYTRDERESALEQEAEERDGRVNLNTASEAELMTLPGIGQSKAAAIVAWREQNGSFSGIEDIMCIEGIKEGVFSKIKDKIKV